MIALARQFTSYVGVGFAAAAIHYSILIALVEGFGVQPVLAALIGYSSGGILSYRLNRSHTFGSERPHREAIWRFSLVAGVGFLLTYAAMFVFVSVLHQPYLAAQIVTTGLTLIWNFGANRLWTFRFEQ
jgi:putative flippase GtrA